jgi:hypothetical protein
VDCQQQQQPKGPPECNRDSIAHAHMPIFVAAAATPLLEESS